MGLSIVAVLKYIIAKLLCKYIMCKQEILQLVLLLLIVSCSYNFLKINLENNINYLNIGSIGDTTNENNINNNINVTITWKLLIEMYRK